MECIDVFYVKGGVIKKMAEENKGVKIKCKRCGHIWVYKGNNKWIAICPHCKTSLSIRKNRVD